MIMNKIVFYSFYYLYKNVVLMLPYSFYISICLYIVDIVVLDMHVK